MFLMISSVHTLTFSHVSILFSLTKFLKKSSSSWSHFDRSLLKFFPVLVVHSLWLSLWFRGVRILFLNCLKRRLLGFCLRYFSRFIFSFSRFDFKKIGTILKLCLNLLKG